MKKKLLVILVLILFTLCLYGCGCKHEWFDDATCTAPKTCPDCGETNGEPLGHEWVDATCTEPKTCTRCKLTEGETIDHTYEEFIFEPYCTDEGFIKYTCSVCGYSYKEVLEATGHKWSEATCNSMAKCEYCLSLKAGYGDHDYENGKCIHCGKSK